MGRTHYIAIEMITLMLVIVLTTAGCGGAKKAQQSEHASEASVLEEYEADFQPSDYDVDVATVFSELRKEKGKENLPTEIGPTVETPIFVPGYRVQLFATTDIDEANSQKAMAQAAFPNEWFTIEYDPPTYKLRAGNFLSRTDAEAFAQILQSSGYHDAWVVPDRVQKNAPTRRPKSPE
jgi:hypothetical protein